MLLVCIELPFFSFSFDWFLFECGLIFGGFDFGRRIWSIPKDSSLGPLRHPNHSDTYTDRYPLGQTCIQRGFCGYVSVCMFDWCSVVGVMSHHLSLNPSLCESPLSQFAFQTVTLTHHTIIPIHCIVSYISYIGTFTLTKPKEFHPFETSSITSFLPTLSLNLL